LTSAGEAFTQLLAHLGWQSEELARRLNDFAERQGRPERLHLKTPYKWKKGDTPRAPWPMLTCALLSHQLGQTINPQDLGWSADGIDAVPASAGLTLPWTAAGGLQATGVVNDAGKMYRRMFLTLLGSALTAPAHEWLIAQPATEVASTTGRNLSGDVVEHLNMITTGLRRMDDHLGGGQTLGLVRQHLSAVVNLLEHRRYTDTVGRRLHATAGEFVAPRGLAELRRRTPQPGPTILGCRPARGARRRRSWPWGRTFSGSCPARPKTSARSVKLSPSPKPPALDIRQHHRRYARFWTSAPPRPTPTNSPPTTPAEPLTRRSAG
jgi:hypothetical protein